MKKVKYVCYIIMLMLVIFGLSMNSYAKFTVNTADGGGHTHSWSSWKTVEKATCVKDGKKERKCTKCSKTETQVIKMLGHSWPSKYSQDAQNHYKVCSRCKTKSSGKHIYGSWTVTTNATCTKIGKRYRTCAICGYKQEETIAKESHTYSSTYTSDATYHYKKCINCTNKQKEKHTFVNDKCSVCGYSKISKTQSTTSSPSTQCKHINKTEATCTEPSKCKDCGEILGEALGHDFVEYDRKDSTCETSGYIYSECTRCKTRRTEVIEKKQHEYVNNVCKICGAKKSGSSNNDTSNNGTSSGTAHVHHYTTFKQVDKKYHREYCSCGDVKLGLHEYKGNICTKCGYVGTSAAVSQAECNHQHKTAATCTNPSRCEDCGAILGEALGHNFVEYDRKDSTCEAIGYIYSECTRCKTRRTEVIEKRQHEYINDVCIYCGKSKKEITTPKHTHVYSEYKADDTYHYKDCTICGKISNKAKHSVKSWQEIKLPTCQTEGTQEGICKVCNQNVTKEIAKTKHKYSGKVGYYTTSTTHSMKCEICGEVDTKKENHKWGNARKGEETGVCTVCGYVCKHPTYSQVYKSTSTKHCLTCGHVVKVDSNGNEVPECVTERDHEFKYRMDNSSHIYACSLCGYVDKTKSGIHVYVRDTSTGKVLYTDLCNGFHQSQCAVCGYVHKYKHIYMNGVCISCGSKNSTGIQDLGEKDIKIFDPDSTDQTKELQEHLKKLGYYNSGIDGDIGKNTINAINALLSDQGSTRQIPAGSKWSDITSEIYSLIMKCEETKEQASIRITNERIQNNEFDLNSIEQRKIIQEKLKMLGYYESGIDGKWGNGTRNAINTLLEYLNSKERLTEKSDWEDISQSMIKLIMNCNETKSEAETRMVNELFELGYDYNKPVQNKTIQEKLKSLGYYTNDADGSFNNGTLNAINEFLKYNGLSDKSLPEGSSWKNVTNDIAKAIIECKETKSMATVRRKTAVLDEVSGVYAYDDSTNQYYELGKEYDERFNEVVRLILSVKTIYSQPERMNGVKAVKAYLENGTPLKDRN